MKFSLTQPVKMAPKVSAASRKPKKIRKIISGELSMAERAFSF
jgi:hypothetical protein